VNKQADKVVFMYQYIYAYNQSNLAAQEDKHFVEAFVGWASGEAS
jgi:hypothetical protein